MVDLGEPGCVEQTAELHELLAARRVTLVGSWDAVLDDDEDPLALRPPTLVVVTNADQIPGVDNELAAFRDLTGWGYPAVVVSVVSGHGLDQIGAFLFQHLGVVRVYTKVPGRPPDLTRPFTVRREQAVHDVAELVHKELAGGLCYARADAGRICLVSTALLLHGGQHRTCTAARQAKPAQCDRRRCSSTARWTRDQPGARRERPTAYSSPCPQRCRG
ncbi:MAG TPA: hypothetical protein VFH23_08005 [Jiangellaceae bacterium]|nr:hypothetical protein [Jiangellaceae bacterium]